jgi:predicted dehydrogenase
MPGPIRFAIIGLDHWYSAVSLAESFAKHPDIDLVGIADRSEKRAHEIAEQMGAPRISTDLNEFILDSNIDAIGSFVTVDQNPEIVIAAAEAGKHILSVKPLARTLDEATHIVQVVKKAGVTFIPAETLSRETDEKQKIHSIVRSGKLGRLVSGTFILGGGLPAAWPGGRADGGWWADPQRVPGGAWIDHSVYQIDLIRWLLGERVNSVSGRISNLVHKNIRVEDYGHAIIEFEGGSIFSLEDTWSSPKGAGRMASSLIGTEGVLNIDTVTGRLSISGADGWNHEPAPSDTTPVGPIVDQIRGKQTSLGTVEDAWENLAVGTAFYESVANSSLVTPQRLPEIPE